MDNKTIELVEQAAIIVLIIFGIFLAYQIMRLVLGGSWSVEDIILSLVIFNLGALFTTGLMLATLKSDVKHLSGKVNQLSDDLKNSTKDFKEYTKKRR